VALIVALSISLCASIGWAKARGTAQTKPNFTGVWKMNPQKSKFDGADAPNSITLKIEQKGSDLTESMAVQDSTGNESVEGKYTIDGNESDVQLGPNTAKGLAKWDGDALVIEWKTDSFNFSRKHTLSADGKTMTMAVRHPGPKGDVNETVVLEKQ
jgi:hypothetical protein